MNLRQTKSNRARLALTIFELLVATAIIAMLLGLLLPSMRVSREAARRMTCSSNFKHIGLSLHNYHNAHKHLPVAVGSADGTEWTGSGTQRLSGLIQLLPYLEQQKLWDEVADATLMRGGRDGFSILPDPWDDSFDPWATQVSTLICPSSPSDSTGLGMTSYAFCVGDMAREIHTSSKTRGVFACRQVTRFKDITDGMAYTIAMGEIGTPVTRDIRGNFALARSESILEDPDSCGEAADSQKPGYYARSVNIADPGRGGCWADGAAGRGLFNTILPPGKTSCSIGDGAANDGIYSAGSFHQGGAHVLMTDGAVIFMTSSVDSGDPSSSTIRLDTEDAITQDSPHGLWGKLGSARGNEGIEEARNY